MPVAATSHSSHNALDSTRAGIRLDLLDLAPTASRRADVVGEHATIDLATSVLRSNALLSIIGSTGGVLRVSKPGVLVPGPVVCLPFWGTRGDLVELVATAQQGLVSAEVTTHRLDDYAEAVGAEETVPGYGATDRVVDTAGQHERSGRVRRRPGTGRRRRVPQPRPARYQRRTPHGPVPARRRVPASWTTRFAAALQGSRPRRTVHRMLRVASGKR